MKNFFRGIQQRKLILSTSAFLCSALLLGISLYFYLDSQEKLEIANINLQSQLSQNQQARDAKQLLDTHAESLAGLKARGVIGTAQRLQWIELTENISMSLGILLVDFTLGKTMPVDEASSAYFNHDIGIETTKMDFEISLRHEGEFFKFMEAMRLNAKGLFSVDECKIIRETVSAGGYSEFPGLNAKCSLIWYSLEDVSRDWELAQQ